MTEKGARHFPGAGHLRLIPPLSVAHLWPLTVLLGIFAFLNTHPIRPHDFWWHAAVGREIVATGRIPAVDTFSFTAAGTPYPSYAMFWLPEVALYGLYTLGGPALVVFAHSIVVTVAYGLTLALTWRLSGSPRVAAAATLFAAALGINDWNVRPQAATFFLAPAFLRAIHEYRRRPRPASLAVFPLGMVLWVNCHGSFPLGLLILGLWLVDEVWRGIRGQTDRSNPAYLRASALALGLAVLAVLVNPRGPQVVSYLATMSTAPVIQNMVPEWAPPTLGTLTGTPFLVGLLLTAALLALSPRRPSPPELLSFLVFAVLGLKTVRGSIWFGLVVAPVWAAHLPAVFGNAAQRGVAPARSWVATGMGGALALLALVTLPWFKERLPLPPAKAGLISAETPVAATEFLLRERLHGPLFHFMPFGSYLIWAAQQEYPVFVDSRIELYPVEVWMDYLHISAAGCGWEERLAHHGVRTLMLSPQEQPALVAAARESPNWRLVYQDEAAVIFTAAP